MIPFSYNDDDDIEDIIDSIFMDDSTTNSGTIFTMDIEQPYQHYHMITDHVAIGDYTTPYDNFDVIFNFNCPFNGAAVGTIHIEMDYYNGAIQKTIYNVGLLDTTIYSNTLLDIFTNLIPYLIEAKNKRILFHCYAGISRSSTAAILYFILTTSMTLDEIYTLLTSKRSHINPNPTFRKIIDICYSMRTQFK